MKFEIRMPKFSPIVVLLVIGLNMWFTDKVLTVIERTSIEPVALITAWFSFTTGELWMLSKIKREKLKKEGENNES